MINEYQVSKYYSQDITKIANYEAAIADTTQTWYCHHKLEMFMTKKELIAIGRYYNVPARELVFLTRKEHRQWPHKGYIEAAKKRIGTHRTNEIKQKIRIGNLGKRRSAETKAKMSAAHVGKHWWNNGVISTLTKECPVGFKKGRL